MVTTSRDRRAAPLAHLILGPKGVATLLWNPPDRNPAPFHLDAELSASLQLSSDCSGSHARRLIDESRELGVEWHHTLIYGISNDVRRDGSSKFSISLMKRIGRKLLAVAPMPELLFQCGAAVCGDVNRLAFLRDKPFLIFLSVSWIGLARRGSGEKEVAFAGVAGKGGGAFEFGAGFGVAAEFVEEVGADAREKMVAR